MITAVANLIPYSITYNQNTTDTVSNMPTPNPQAGNLDVNSTTTVTLSNNTPTRSGYVFKGWCTIQVADDAACTGTEYQPSSTYNIDYLTGNNTFTLYARWVQPTIYDEVAAMSKGTQTTANLKSVITKPTSNDPATDTSNSGVYLYDESTFGTAADSNKSDGTRANIYYYRGILDSNLDETSSSSYGSNGDGFYYPNYVILDANSTKDATDTCWRIVRTTASGGVKMIYNGTWDTTNNTCAHAQTGAQLATRQAFGLQGNSAQSMEWHRNINRVGYTFNNDPSIQDNTTATSVGTVFGSNDNYGVNGENSNIKNYIETWFAGSNGISAYESILEPNAGYCNDRTLNSGTSWTTPLIDSDTIVPYGTSGLTAYYFGSYTRNFLANGNKTLTLSCPRGVVDLYTYKTDNNTNLNGGNGQLTKPIALITADESALAGSGYGRRTTDSTSSSNYSYSSYLRSGSNFWLLSPFLREAVNGAVGFLLDSSGHLNGNLVIIANGVRPAISLTSGTIYSSGTGTAADPWVVDAP
ncbi:InlB B-repeat-containing protein [Candidatus Saccharibacteria bacterium]|nr:InlB B-repeat-containing protein [Candidatus Saccharibacteria bacterium]